MEVKVREYTYIYIYIIYISYFHSKGRVNYCLAKLIIDLIELSRNIQSIFIILYYLISCWNV